MFFGYNFLVNRIVVLVFFAFVCDKIKKDYSDCGGCYDSIDLIHSTNENLYGGVCSTTQ